MSFCQQNLLNHKTIIVNIKEEYEMYKKQAGIIVAGAAIGGAQTFILREFVDGQYGPIIPGIGSWGNPSVVAGLAGGGVTSVLAVLGVLGKGPIKDDDQIYGLLAYGIPAIVGGIYSGLYPIGTPSAGGRLIRPTMTRVQPTLRVSNSQNTASRTREILA